MPRIVTHTATGPIKIEPQPKPVWMCACGISATFPICDGSHKACAGEEEGRVYVYGADRTRAEWAPPARESSKDEGRGLA